MGTEFQFGKVSLEKDGGDGCTTVRMYSASVNCTLKMVNLMFCVFYDNKNKTEPPSSSSYCPTPQLCTIQFLSFDIVSQLTFAPQFDQIIVNDNLEVAKAETLKTIQNFLNKE